MKTFIWIKTLKMEGGAAELHGSIDRSDGVGVTTEPCCNIHKYSSVSLCLTQHLFQ